MSQRTVTLLELTSLMGNLSFASRVLSVRSDCKVQSSKFQASSPCFIDEREQARPCQVETALKHMEWKAILSGILPAI